MERKRKWGVYAPKDGIVINALKTESDYGYRIYIRYPDGYASIHAHNKKLLVKEGQAVKQGQLIAIMGDTGVGERHGHFGLIPPKTALNNLLENCVNPVPWLVNGGDYPYNTKVSGAFQEWYGSYFHEGIDFSGQEENLINGWKKGLKADKQRYYV
jgi:murein DD-endopeptidase MepM/ murein hydrolase activator NlpD